MRRFSVATSAALLLALALVPGCSDRTPPATETTATVATDSTPSDSAVETETGGEYGDLTKTYRKTEATAQDAVEKAKKARQQEKEVE